MYCLIIVAENFPVTTQATHGKGHLMSHTFSLSVSIGMSRKLFSRFSTVFIGIKSRKETSIDSYFSYLHSTQVKAHCAGAEELLSFWWGKWYFPLKLWFCGDLATCHGQFISSYLIQLLNMESLCLTPRNLSKSKGPFQLANICVGN